MTLITDRSDGLANCIEGLGDPSIDTRLQTYRTWGYQPSVEGLEQEFIQNWMAYIECTLLARTMYRAGYDLINVTPEIDTAAVASYAEGELDVRPDGTMVRKKGLSWYAREVKIQGDKFGGAALFPILEDGLDPRMPLNLHRIERVVGWTVFDRREITPIPDGRNTRPQYYMLSDVTSLATASGGQRALTPGDVIHHSRLFLHLGREGLSSREQRNRQWWGLSILELNHRARIAAERASEYLSSYIAKCSWLHYAIAGLDEILQRKDAAGNEIGEAWVRQRIHAFRRNLTSFGVAVTDGGREGYTDANSGQMIPARPGDNLESIIESSGDLSKIADYKATEWARGAELPESIAFSQTGNTGLQGGENGGDWQKFGGDVQAAQNGEGTEVLNWMYMIEFSARQGPTKGMRPESWQIRWKPLRLPTPLEIAQIAKAQAEADEVRIRSQVIEAKEVRDQRLVRGDTDGPLRAKDTTDESAGVGPAQVGIATAILEGAMAAGRGEITPEFFAGYLQDIDGPRFPAEVATARAEAARPKGNSPGLPEGSPLPAAVDAAPVIEAAAVADAEEAAPPEAFSTDPRPSDLMLPGDLAEIVTTRFGIGQGSSSITAMAKRHGLRRWQVGTKSGYSRAEIIAAYEGQIPPEPIVSDESIT